MGRSSWTLALAAVAVFCAAATQCVGAPRLTIKNQCTDDVWAVVTAGGSPAHPVAQGNSAGWFHDNYATQEEFLQLAGPPGENLTGSMAGGSRTLTLSSQPVASATYFVAGQIVKVVGAGVGGADLVSSVLSVANQDTVLTLQNQAQTAVTKALVEVDNWVGAVLIKSKEAMSFPAIPAGGAPGANFKFFIGCPNGNTDPFNNAGCTIGAAAGDLAQINTLFEPTFGCIKGTADCAFNPGDKGPQFPNCQANPTKDTCGPLAATDNFDISAVDGYTLPMKVTAKGTDCSAPSKNASMLDLGSCPSENSGTLFSTDTLEQTAIENKKGIKLLTKDADGNLKACAAPYKWFLLTTVGKPVNPDKTPPPPVCGGGTCNSVSYYAGAGCDRTNLLLACPADSGPQQRVGPARNGEFAIQNTNYVMDLHALGYTGYTWQYDDGVGSQTCDAGAAITVTLCPGSNKRPYRKAEWGFNPDTGNCRVAKGGGGDLYPSLAACQQANMRYVCTKTTDVDPYKVPGAMWQASAAATRGGVGLTYPEWFNKKKLKCTNMTVDVPDGKMTLPVCIYYYGGKHLCPPGSSL